MQDEKNIYLALEVLDHRDENPANQEIRNELLILSREHTLLIAKEIDNYDGKKN